jgi:hypothetical protein
MPLGVFVKPPFIHFGVRPEHPFGTNRPQMSMPGIFSKKWGWPIESSQKPRPHGVGGALLYSGFVLDQGV